MKNTNLANVPFTRVAADADIENLRKMLEGDTTLVMNDDGTVSEKGKEQGEKKKLGDVPTGKLGISLREFLSKKDDEESEATEPEEKPDADVKPLGDVPVGKLGATQWYTRPEMQEQLAFEKAGMLKYIGTPVWGVNCGTLDDGRMFF